MLATEPNTLVRWLPNAKIVVDREGDWWRWRTYRYSVLGSVLTGSGYCRSKTEAIEAGTRATEDKQ